MSDVPASRPGKLDNILADIIIGISDGLSVPFAVAAGISAGAGSTQMVLTAGLAATLIGAAGMGISGYHTVRNENTGPRENRAFYANLGFTEDMQNEAMKALVKEQADIQEQLSEEEFNSPGSSGLAIGLSYFAGGLIPLSPYFFLGDSLTALKIAAPVTLLSLFIFGYLKNRLANANPWAGALRMLTLGTLAAGAAFLLARIIS